MDSIEAPVSIAVELATLAIKAFAVFRRNFEMRVGVNERLVLHRGYPSSRSNCIA